MNKKFDDDMLAKICEMVGKNTIEEIQAATEAELIIADDLREMAV